MVIHKRTLLLASLLCFLANGDVSAEKAADLTIVFSSNVSGELEPCG